MHLPPSISCLLLALMPLVCAGADEPYTYVHHPVSTGRPAAQEAFDRGLTLVFAYQNSEAEIAFRQAAKLDPELAMAWWGIGLALGNNINSQPDAVRTHEAAGALRRAAALAAQRATSGEREYITALAARYSEDEPPDFDALAKAYRETLRALVHAHPEDADAAALYAEAIMDLRPWQLWTSDGAPAPDTEELVAMLEEHLRRAPDHIGLLHFYIHAVEASKHPERALQAARRLGAMPMEPAAAHLVHMPAHIYLRVGDWPAAIDSNRHAVHHALDYQLSQSPATERACGHCLDFLRFAFAMAGNLAGARDAAEQFEHLTGDASDSLAVLARFGQWDDLLAFPQPPLESKHKLDSPHLLQGFWHYARGIALAATGHPERAELELAALREEAKQLPAPAVVAPGALGVSTTLDRLFARGDRDALAMADHALSARIDQARGRMREAIVHWRAAVDIQDHTAYGEPPTWYYPIRESLGASLLQAGEASSARAVFSADLRHNPNNPRSLFGLAAACRAEHDVAAARAADAKFRAAWQRSDRVLTLKDL